MMWILANCDSSSKATSDIPAPSSWPIILLLFRLVISLVWFFWVLLLRVLLPDSRPLVFFFILWWWLRVWLIIIGVLVGGLLLILVFVIVIIPFIRVHSRLIIAFIIFIIHVMGFLPRWRRLCKPMAFPVVSLSSH